MCAAKPPEGEAQGCAEYKVPKADGALFGSGVWRTARCCQAAPISPAGQLPPQAGEAKQMVQHARSSAAVCGRGTAGNLSPQLAMCHHRPANRAPRVIDPVTA